MKTAYGALWVKFVLVVFVDLVILASAIDTRLAMFVDQFAVPYGLCSRRRAQI